MVGEFRYFGLWKRRVGYKVGSSECVSASRQVLRDFVSQDDIKIR
jgi:hypothetical protein